MIEMPRSFDENYPTNEEYKRFHNKDTSFAKGRRAGYPSFANPERKKDNMIKEIPGFSRVDYAFSSGAFTVGQATRSGRGNMNSGLYLWKSLGVAYNPEDVPAWKGTPKQAAKVVEKAGLYYGASKVGFTALDKRWVYSHTGDNRPIVFEDVEEGYINEEKVVIPESHKYVIAIAVPMEVEEILYTPAALSPATGMGYSRMAITAGSLAEFIRGLGYHAIPCGNDTAVSIPIAVQAGLGHVGRMGRLITWERGPMVRIAKIFTDMPLEQSPMAPDGIIEFCEVCGKCAKHCPSQSITHDPRTWEGPTDANNNGAYKWYINADTCYEYWRQVGSGCGVCFRVCSFTKHEGFLHDMVKWFIRYLPIFNRAMVWADEALDYGKIKDPRKYWDEPIIKD